MRHFLGIVIALGLVVSSEARASTCFVAIATTSSGDLPLGCAVTVVMVDSVEPPQVFALRQGVGTVEVTGAITETTTEIDIHLVGLNEPCEPDFDQTTPSPYTIYTIEVNTQEGDVLALGGFDAALGTVVAAGGCPGAPPIPETITCDVSQPCFPDEPDEPGPDEDGGCSTGRGGAFGAIAVLGLLVARRRRTVTV